MDISNSGCKTTYPLLIPYCGIERGNF
nr:unnamed protein product [Callosobruchus chinensis]